MNILGISAFYHDSAACLISNGKIVAAVQEERFTRLRHDSSFPHKAILYCIEASEITVDDIDFVVYYEKPFLKFERILETFLAFAPSGFQSFVKAMPLWVKEKLFQKSLIINQLSITLGQERNWRDRLLFSEHHISHAASAFYPSPFDRAAVLTLDGVGEWTTTSVAIGRGSELKTLQEIHFPHSLGLLYSAFTYYTGFKVNSGEYKVMGLAPYGEPKYTELIKDYLIKTAEDGSFQLDLSYFNYTTGLTMTNKKFEQLFGGPPRRPESEITQREMDLAASIQRVTEEILLKIAQNIADESGEKNLCLAGGVALNCVANGVLSKANIFENIWVQPAAGDAGGALGAALAVWHLHLGQERTADNDQDLMQGAYLGPEFREFEIESALKAMGAHYVKLSEEDLIEQVAAALVAQGAVGWMQGRMEFGPRALGARSILADPRSPHMQEQLNLKVKFRESFRPFAPSVLSEHANEWFEHERRSPYMLFTSQLKDDKRLLPAVNTKPAKGFERLQHPHSIVPAVTHIDGSARFQTVHPNTNPRFHALIAKFHEATGCPLLVNTSFNVRGEPIVCTPEDAFKCFMGTNLDVLAIGNFLLRKSDQDTTPSARYTDRYALD